MLLPLTGDQAALARNMARAATLPQGFEKKALITIDTGGTPAGATAAARQALKQGAGIIFGPLQAAEARAVQAEVAGRMPVVTFSNDLSLLESGLFLFGITADQAAAPLLRYARARGVRRVGLSPGNGAWGVQLVAAARKAAAAEGVEIASDRAAQLDAVLVGTMAEAVDRAPSLKRTGTQLLCAFSGFDAAQEPLGALDGAWLSTPDPAPFADFAARFEAQVGTRPGVIAGLAYDASGILMALRKGGDVDRSALLTATGFQGVCGGVRFRDNGSAVREMVILSIDQGRIRIVSGNPQA